MTVKAIAAFLGDVLVCFVAIAWCWQGPWINLLGFSVYHSRGDVWLPTPPAAVAFFQGMVLTGTIGFALTVLLVSIATLFLGPRTGTTRNSEPGHLLYAAFYGNPRKLAVRYLVFLLSVFVSPYFYNFMWRFRGSRSFRIAGGLAMTLLAYAIILIAGQLLVAAARTNEQSALNR